MSRVASQLGAAFNQQLRQWLPGIQVLEVPRGLPRPLPADVRVLLAAPHGEWLEAAGPPAGWPFALELVQLVTSGLDFFPPWLFRSVAVTSARGTSAATLAEFALATIFAAAKQLPQVWIDGPQHWQQRPLASVSGSTLGLFGFGRIAQALAPKAQALGMQVLALRHSAQPFEVPGVEGVADVHELFARADHLLLAAPLTERTRHVIGPSVLASAKPGLHLINLARGALIDQAALLQALDSGRIALASLDVSDPEPLPAGHPLYRHPRVRLSPHTSANCPEVYRQIALLLGRNLAHLAHGRALENAVSIAIEEAQP